MELIIISAIGIILMMCLMLSFFIKQRRNILYDQLDLTFDRMQIFITKHDLDLTRNLKEFIVRHKMFVVNKKLTDIEVLLFLLNRMDPNKLDANRARWQEVRIDLPEDLLKISDEFTIHIDKLVKLSTWKPKFILFVMVRSIYRLIAQGIDGCKSIPKSIHTALANESSIAISYAGQRFAV